MINFKKNLKKKNFFYKIQQRYTFKFIMKIKNKNQILKKFQKKNFFYKIQQRYIHFQIYYKNLSKNMYVSLLYLLYIFLKLIFKFNI